MPTFTARSTVASQGDAERLSDALERLVPEPIGIGLNKLEDEPDGWEVEAYFDRRPDAVRLDLLAASAGSPPFAISQLPETDWVAKVERDLKPVTAGRFFVHGGHDAQKVPDDALGLLVEASLAFGTGHHGTTMGCLRALDRLVDSGQVFNNIADVGCGTAVLAMAARLVSDGAIIASDIDPVAVEVARDNIQANGLGDTIECVVAAGFGHPALRDGAPFDLIFANILKGPLIDLAPDMAAASSAGGVVILSGILNEQADDVLHTYSQSGYNLVEKEEIGDWTTLTLRKSG